MTTLPRSRPRQSFFADLAGAGPSAGIAIVMPAYREEENLAATVADFLQVPGLAASRTP